MLAHPAMQKQRIVRRQNSLPFGLLQCVISKEQIAILHCIAHAIRSALWQACGDGRSLSIFALRYQCPGNCRLVVRWIDQLLQIIETAFIIHSEPHGGSVAQSDLQSVCVRPWRLRISSARSDNSSKENIVPADYARGISIRPQSQPLLAQFQVAAAAIS